MPQTLTLRHTISDTNVRLTSSHTKKSGKILAKPHKDKKDFSIHRVIPKPQSFDNIDHKEHFSVYEAERYCALDLSGNPYALKTQRRIASWLAKYYKNGGSEASADHWKAETYAILANASLSKAEATKKINQLNEWNFKRTQSWYALLGWFTSTRLVLSRLNRVFDLIGYGLKTRVFAIGGFSYGIELLLDMGVVLKHIVMPDRGEKHLPWYSRVANAMTKDNRWYRILNAAVWLGVNVAAFILTGGISAILNLLGFTFDPINELVLSWAELDTNERLLDKFKNKLEKLDNSLSTIAKDDFQQYKEHLLKKEMLEKELADLRSVLQKQNFPRNQEKLLEREEALEQKIAYETRELSILSNKIKSKKMYQMLRKNDYQQYAEHLLKKEILEKELANLYSELKKQNLSHDQEKSLLKREKALKQKIADETDKLSILHRTVKPKKTNQITEQMLQEYIKTRLEISKQSSTLKNLTEQRIYTVCVVLGVLVGMGLFLFPPAGIPAIVGAAIALSIGSIIGGFGRRIYNNRNVIKTFFSNLGKKIKGCFQKTPTPESIPLLSPRARRNSVSQQSRIPRSISLPAMLTIDEGDEKAAIEAEDKEQTNPSLYSRLSIFAPESPKAQTEFLTSLAPLASAYTPSVSN